MFQMVSMTSLGTVNKTMAKYTYPTWVGIIQLCVILVVLVTVLTYVVRTFEEHRYVRQSTLPIISIIHPKK